MSNPFHSSEDEYDHGAAGMMLGLVMGLKALAYTVAGAIGLGSVTWLYFKFF